MNRAADDLHHGSRLAYQRALTCLAASAASFTLCGCSHATEINVVGAYFPVWLLAMIVGVIVAFVARYSFVRIGLEPYLRSLTLVYVCITVSVACLVWLLFA